MITIENIADGSHLASLHIAPRSIDEAAAAVMDEGYEPILISAGEGLHAYRVEVLAGDDDLPE